MNGWKVKELVVGDARGAILVVRRISLFVFCVAAFSLVKAVLS